MKQEIVKPVQPSAEEWSKLTWERNKKNPELDVIIPVYGAPDDTLRCIYSVLNVKNQTPFNLIVIEDCGPVPELRSVLKQLSAKFSFEYYENEKNKGFVLTCNFGFELHPDRDVILLNSDTEVFDGWLDTLIECAKQNPKAGTITAMSNNATICSHPLFCEDFSHLYEISDTELSKLFYAENLFETVNAPTGVGFCMYISRACLNQIGYFNYDLFGKGYGEENDLCVRAKKAGWDNLIAGGVFVRHYGSSSFSNAQRLERVQKAIETIKKEHPNYLTDVAKFIEADPVLKFRNKIDKKRLETYIESKKVFLLVSHALGGGTEKHVLELAEKLALEGFAVLCLQPKGKKVVLSIEGKYPLPNLDIPTDKKGIDQLLDSLNIKFMHIHHLKGFNNSFIDEIMISVRSKNIPYYFTLHDYYSICPKINLIDDSGLFCGEPEERQCNNCIKTCSDVSAEDTIERWRGWYLNILKDAQKIFVPDLDVKWRFMRYFPNLTFHVRPHFDSWLHEQDCPRKIDYKKDIKDIFYRKKIGIIGAIGHHKGFYILKTVAEICAHNEFDLEFIVIGYTQDDAALTKNNNVKILGKYHDDDLIDIIMKENLDAVWFPAVSPETYSYTLSACMVTGLPIIAFDFGAIDRRLSTEENYIPVPIEYMIKPQKIIQYLLQEKKPSQGRKIENTYDSLEKDYYQIQIY